MKKSFFSLGLLATLVFIVAAFTTADNGPKAIAPDYIMKDYKSSVYNAELEARFELQFADMFNDVTHIDIHENVNSGYFYTVYGTNDAGELVVDFFKTTEAEVLSETYNYIEMTERTMQGSRLRKCREAITFPFPSGYFCHPNNPGYICGIEVRPNQCFLY